MEKNMITCLKRFAFSLFCASAVASFAQNASPALAQPIKILVDATRAPEKVLHAQLQIPVTPGDVTLVYPKWIPGEHGPTGPITDLTGVQFFANGQRLAWRRDCTGMSAARWQVVFLRVRPTSRSTGGSSSSTFRCSRRSSGRSPCT